MKTVVLECGHAVEWKEWGGPGQEDAPYVGRIAWCGQCESDQEVVEVDPHFNTEEALLEGYCALQNEYETLRTKEARGLKYISVYPQNCWAGDLTEVLRLVGGKGLVGGNDALVSESVLTLIKEHHDAHPELYMLQERGLRDEEIIELLTQNVEPDAFMREVYYLARPKHP